MNPVHPLSFIDKLSEIGDSYKELHDQNRRLSSSNEKMFSAIESLKKQEAILSRMIQECETLRASRQVLIEREQEARVQVNALRAEVDRLTKGDIGVVCHQRDRYIRECNDWKQRAVNAEMELLALKSPKLPQDVRDRMDADRAHAESVLPSLSQNPPMPLSPRRVCRHCGGDMFIVERSGRKTCKECGELLI